MCNAAYQNPVFPRLLQSGTGGGIEIEAYVDRLETGPDPHLCFFPPGTPFFDQQEIFDGASPTSFGISIAIHRPVWHTPSPTGKEMRYFMSIEKTMMRTTRETPSAPRRETFIPPTLLPVCCACGIIRDDTRFSPGRELWITQRTYRETHGVNPSVLALSHTHCPTCFRKVEETMRQDFKEIGPLP
jgi:hypothetical protein